ncbi:nuclear pore complex protein Nup50 [Bombyx mori]|uniref:RanBD1 domain-containing protein n=1 Tax=Bombyx mori TaxID=7091 RepID=A0A8R2C717_BOMMO|nr:nuclear pore complex protein Nup50 [Bombyx mori]
MSVKRQATTDLNHENWDQEDPEENKEMGTFKAAPKDILEKRVIKTAKRRTTAPTDENKKTQGLFSGFGAFNKAPSSFDFLANLTKDSKSNATTTSAESGSAGLFSNKLSNDSGSLLSPSSAPINTPLGTSTSQTPTLFSSATSTVTFSSVFTTTKAGPSATDSLFKVQPTLSTATTAVLNATKTTTIPVPNIQATSSIFGVSQNNTVSKSLFSTTNNSSSIFQTQSTQSPLNDATFGTNKQLNTNITQGTEKKEEQGDKKLKYYAKLKGLNESVSDWIKKHVDETPLCILTPIFRDYEAYLKEIQEEYHGPDGDCSEIETKNNVNSETKNPVEKSKNGIFSESSRDQTVSGSSIFKLDPSKPFSTTPLSSSCNMLGDKPKGFSFGINTATSTINSIPAISTGFSFGTSSTNSNNIQTSNTFSFGLKSSPSSDGSPLKFGAPSLTSTNTNNTEPANQEDEDVPPKVEFTPIAEENSVFDKRCKVFVKKDGNFVDKGVGTLYIKKIENSDKHQLLVRANTALGNILLNLRLSAGIPTQRMGKNNVMIICIPTPDSKPPPTSVLIRVKTPEEADEVLETLNKYKA